VSDIKKLTIIDDDAFKVAMKDDKQDRAIGDRNYLYQCCIRGRGFNGPGQEFPAQAIKLGREKARQLDLEGPFHFAGEPKHQYKRSEAFEEATKRLRRIGPNHDPIVLLSHEYDRPGLAWRAIKQPDKADVAEWVRNMEIIEVPCCSYGFGSIPGLPCPTKGDCSGTVKWAVERATGIILPHSAAEMYNDNRIDPITDPDNVKSGDFIFYWFGSERRPADDVALVYGDARSGMQIGARPSVKPGYSHDGVQIWSMEAPGEESHRLRFGRLKGA